jgi:hypothetical protein
MKTKNLVSISYMTLACLAFVSQVACADIVSYDFTGILNNNWGWNFPVGYPPIGSLYSGSVVYDTSVPGVIDSRFENTLFYSHALISLSFDVAGYSINAQGGSIYVQSTVQGSGIDFEAENAYGSIQSGNIDGYIPNTILLGLKVPSGPLPGGTILPADLSFLNPIISQSFAEPDVISPNGVDAGRFVTWGPLTSLELSEVPEPSIFAFGVLGVVGVLTLGRRNPR